MTENPIIETAMQIIVYAGDGRNYIKEALDAAMEDNDTLAEEKLKTAHECLAKAHECQTDLIQKEAEGESCSYSLLFTHAQDTMMTIYSELHMAEKMIAMYRRVNEKINQKKA